MDYELKSVPPEDGEAMRLRHGAGFEISSAPIVPGNGSVEAGGLPRSTTGPTLCLMARDPHTLFAYWDIDWTGAFGAEQPSERKVHLRVINADGFEQAIEVEPLAGSCYVDVQTADTIYSGEIGYYQPETVWNRLAASDVISTPPETLSDFADDNFATVPFHLSFQHMIEMLRQTRRDDAPLVVQLAELRAGREEKVPRSANELVNVVAEVEATPSLPELSRLDAAELWRRQRLGQILGFGPTSPGQGFGAGS